MAQSSNFHCSCKDDVGQRVFEKHAPVICYEKAPATQVDPKTYDEKRVRALQGTEIETLIVPKRAARTWTMRKDDLCRITLVEGSQVGDLNFWNLENPKERFYSGKTRQLHGSHLKVYDRLWSNLPYLRPMVTFVYDTLRDYGIDEDGGAIHDVIGTRCDGYTIKLITGKDSDVNCNSLLAGAIIKERQLSESDVHDVWNIFMCTGFTKDTHQYFCKPSPARKGDYIEFIADMDLLVALCCCPQGDVSIPVGKPVPDDKCFPLKVEVFRQKSDK